MPYHSYSKTRIFLTTGTIHLAQTFMERGETVAVEFSAQLDPSDDMCRREAACVGEIRFFTLEYLEAMRRQDYRICLLSIYRGDQLICGCPALIHSGHFSRTLMINSISSLSQRGPPLCLLGRTAEILLSRQNFGFTYQQFRFKRSKYSFFARSGFSQT